MTDSSSRFTAHEQRLAHSYALLQEARDRAREDSKYDSVTTRQKMTEACKIKTGLTPREEQLDIAECLLLGLDATLIAGTGWGKTLAFALPAFVQKRKVSIIISPLNVLEADQAARFSAWDLPAIGLNGITYTDAVHEAMEAGAYRFIIVGPELCVDADSRFRPLLSNPKFSKRVGAVIIDEAHCITQWGSGFRPKYADLDTLRALLRIHVSVLLASATMPPVALAQARRTMHIHSDNSFHLNLGNDRANISWEVRRMSAGKSDLEALRFLVPSDVAELSCFPRTIVFFNDIMVSMRALRWFREQIPEHLRTRVKGFHARRRQLGKDITFEEFRTGRVDILFATESAGMGCDIPDIVLIVQFMAPDSLSIWVQRAGRAGRSPDLQARAVLLIESSAFHEKGKAKRKPGEPVEYVKQLEPGMRLWVDPPPDACRRDVADEYFDNPQRHQGPTGACCDKCGEQVERQNMSFVFETGNDAPATGQAGVGPSRSSATAGQPIWRSAVPATRTDAYLMEATHILQKWRQQTWLALYNTQPYGPPGILPDATLKTLAVRTTYLTVDDLATVPWHYVTRHGQDVLDALHALDRKRALDVLVEEAEKRAASEAQKAAEREERELIAQQKRETKALEKFVADQRKAAERAEKERKKAEEAARKKAERAAEKEAQRVQREQKKAEDKARKAEEKAMRKAEEQKSKPPGRRKRKRGHEKENEALEASPASKRAREDEAGLTPPAIVVHTEPLPRRPRPKPRPVPKRVPISNTSTSASQATTVPVSGPSSQVAPPCTPLRPPMLSCVYPTADTPSSSLSLSRLLVPTTPSPFPYSGVQPPVL